VLGEMKLAKSKHLTLTTLSIIEAGNVDHGRILARSPRMNLMVANGLDALVDLGFEHADCGVAAHEARDIN
jgi:hypothetical protein